MTLPTNAEERKAIPIYTGFVKYFPDAMAAVAKISQRVVSSNKRLRHCIGTGLNQVTN